MKAYRSAPWVLGAGMIAVLVVVAAWFLAISPTLTSAADARSKASDERDRNDVLTQQVAVLKDQFTHLDEYKTELGELRKQIPAKAELAAFNRQLQTLATTAGVTLSSVSPSVSQAFVPLAPIAPVAPAAPADGTATPAPEPSATPTDGTGAPVAPAPTGPTAPAGFYLMPISLTVIGSYQATWQYLNLLQTGGERLMLVTTINATAQAASGAADGKPATTAGDLETTVTGYVYVLQDQTAPAPEPTEGDTKTPLPVPGTQKNPFGPSA